MSAAGTERLAQSPDLPSEHGIALVGQLAGNAPRLYGSFCLPPTIIESVPRPLHRSLVLVAQLGVAAVAVSPFENHVLMIDDDELTHAGVTGFFDIDVNATMGAPGAPPYFLSVSIGPHVSNVVALGDGVEELIAEPPSVARLRSLLANVQEEP